ncbi:hypothetical protein [Faecalicatena contorta]|nr:hypothetical protein [Faecalicatena contorta]
MAAVLEDYIFNVGSVYTNFLTRKFIESHFDILKNIKNGLGIK